MDTQHIKKEWLSPKEVNQEFGFSVSTLAKYRMNNKGINYAKIGKYIKYKRADIEIFLNDNLVNAVDEVELWNHLNLTSFVKSGK